MKDKPKTKSKTIGWIHVSGAIREGGNQAMQNGENQLDGKVRHNVEDQGRG